jgi:glycine cleavage system regulatory protein
MDDRKLILTATAKDRPGVVEAISQVVASHSGSWVDSSMVRMGGEFAGIVKISVPAQNIEDVTDALSALAKENIEIAVHEKGTSPHVPAAGQHVRLQLTGLDRTGIVLEVTGVLARFDVSIEDLQTASYTASMSGQIMFSAKVGAVVPDSVDVAELRNALEQIAHDIMVDINLTEAK